MDTNTSVKPCKCPFCPQSVATPQGLKSHITRKHPQESQTKRATNAVNLDNFNISHQASLAPPSNTPQDVNPLATLLESLGMWRSSLCIIRRIPKGARSLAASALADTIDQVLKDNSAYSWGRLLSFTAICFSLPHFREAPQSSLTALLLRHIREFLEGRQTPLYLRTNSSRSTRTSFKPQPQHIIAKISDGDVRGAVRLLSSEDGFAPDDPNTVEVLRRQHPSSVSEDYSYPPPPDTAHVSFQASEAEVKGAVSSFPCGSAGGIDLLRPQHLKDLLSRSSGPAGSRLLTSLTALCNRMLDGRIPEWVCPILYGASLCALNKKDGGVRPIAIGCTLRRLTSKLCCLHISDLMGSSLRPQQFGFGTSLGLEIATHTVRRYVHSTHPHPKVILKVDFKNAFNTLRRDRMLATVSQVTPELFPYIYQCYRDSTHLLFGNHFLSSVSGVQQGDPMGPALFCLTLQPVIEQLSSDLNLWYLDDGTLAGAPETVLGDYITLRDNSVPLGLELNPLKCELFLLAADSETSTNISRTFSEIATGVPLLPVDQCTQLGSPLFPAATASFLETKIDSLRRVVKRLHDLPSHCAFHILRFSQSLPKLLHVLRCAPTWECSRELNKFDDTLREALCSIINVPLTDKAWDQATWPVAMGGLGIRKSQDISLPAFLASAHGTLAQVDSLLPASIRTVPDAHLANCLSLWKELSGASPIPLDKFHVQKEWDRPVSRARTLSALSLATQPLDKARLLGVQSQEAGAFLNTIPSEQLGTLLEDEEFRVAVSLRLGTVVCQPHTCACGTETDSLGIHGLSCKRSSGRILRHASLNDVLLRALHSARIPSTLEPTHLDLTSQCRPDGLSLIPWSNGKSVIWDVTCVNSLASSYLNFSSVELGYAANLAERNKCSKYSHLTPTYIFAPVAVECLGSYGSESLKFIKSLGTRIRNSTGDPQACTYLIQRLSVALQKGNARSILGSLSSDRSLDDRLC